MFEYDKYIEYLLESFMNEGTYDKDYDIPTEEEINSGGMTTIYRCAHASQIENIFKVGYNRAFCASNDGTWYGDGVYCNVTLQQAIIGCKTLDPSREEGRKYGSTIVSNKLIGGFDRFLIFNEEIARKKYGDKWRVEDQVKYLFNPNDAKRVLEDMRYIMSISPSAKQMYHGRTAQMLQDMFHNRKGRISRFEYDKIFKANNIRGAIYTGGNDGLCAVVYDFSAVIPYATTTDYGKTWKKRFNMKEFLHRMETKIDVNQRFDGKYKNIERPVETVDPNGKVVSYSLVTKFNGKQNYINPKTGEEIFPVDFDTLTAFNNKGVCQGEYKGRIYDITINGYYDELYRKWHSWDVFKNRRIIPTEDELDTNMLPSLYHVASRNDVDSIFRNGIHPDFGGEHGDVFGRGAYSSIKPEYARTLVGGFYGGVIIQCKVIDGFDGFICFGKEAQMFVYHKLISVHDQLLKYLPKKQAEEIYKYVGEDNARILQKVCAKMHINKIRGAIYNWSGIVAALPYDYSSLIPYAVSIDGGKTFRKRFDNDTLNMIHRNMDSQFSLMGRYEKVEKPVQAPILDDEGDIIGHTGYAKVMKKNGRWNYVDSHTRQEVLPFDFDSLTSVDNNGEFQGEYKGKLYNMCSVGFFDDRDGEWHTWEDFPK